MAPRTQQQRQDETHYTNIGQDDHDDRSSTEIGSLMEEKQWGLEAAMPERVHESRTKRICAFFNSWRWLIDTTLLVAILVLLLRMQKPWFRLGAEDYQLSGDITDFSPRCRFSLFCPPPGTRFIADTSLDMPSFAEDCQV